jgi:hypothetical protein
LKGIIGKRRKDDVSEGRVTVATNSEKPVRFVESIDFGDLSLEGFLERGNRKTRPVGTEEGVRTAEQCGFYLSVVEAIWTALLMVPVDKNDRARFQDLHNAIAVSYLPLLVTGLLNVLIILFHRVVMKS